MTVGEWDQEKAYNVTQSILLAHPKVAGTFACNDRMAMGALGFVGKEGSPYRQTVKIVGFDAADDARGVPRRVRHQSPRHRDRLFGPPA